MCKHFFFQFSFFKWHRSEQQLIQLIRKHDKRTVFCNIINSVYVRVRSGDDVSVSMCHFVESIRSISNNFSLFHLSYIVVVSSSIEWTDLLNYFLSALSVLVNLIPTFSSIWFCWNSNQILSSCETNCLICGHGCFLFHFDNSFVFQRPHRHYNSFYIWLRAAKVKMKKRCSSCLTRIKSWHRIKNA